MNDTISGGLTSQEKATRLSKAYQDYMRGEITSDELHTAKELYGVDYRAMVTALAAARAGRPRKFPPKKGRHIAGPIKDPETGESRGLFSIGPGYIKLVVYDTEYNDEQRAEMYLPPGGYERIKEMMTISEIVEEEDA